MPEAESRVQVRLDTRLADWLGDRTERCHIGSHHVQARTELDLWRSALTAELRRISLTLAEACCLADVLNGHLITPVIGRPGIVYAEAADAFSIARRTPVPDLSSYGTKHGCDEQALLNYLLDLGPTADHALLDAISRWWERGLPPTVEGFAEVGLRADAQRLRN